MPSRTATGNRCWHLTGRKDKRVGPWEAASDADIAHTSVNTSWLNRIEAQLTALRYFALDGLPRHPPGPGSVIHRHISWHSNHAYDERLRRILDRQTFLNGTSQL
jgi:hypothetical protein